MAKFKVPFRDWFKKSAPVPSPAKVSLPYGTATDPLARLPFSQGDLYGAAMFGDRASVARMMGELPKVNNPPRVLESLSKGIRLAAYNYNLGKALETRVIQGKRRAIEAAAQGTNVNWAMDSWGVYDTNGIRHPTTMTFDFLRYFCSHAECIAWIIGKRVNQVMNFSRVSEITRGMATEPGFKIMLTKKRDKPTPKDTEIIEELEQYIQDCGYCAPPMENRRLGWQPGFAAFLAELTRDRLTLDHVAIRRWRDANDPDNGDIVSFACEDAGRILYWSREFVQLTEDGMLIDEPRPGDRTSTDKEIVLVKVDDSGMKVEEFTDDEVVVAHGRMRTDKTANGYGYSEAEEAYEYATLFVAARDFNGLRFTKDSLPRGIMSIAGNMTDNQFGQLQKFFKESTSGLSKRWNIPMIKMNPQAGAGIQFIPFDMSPRDMEHSQTTYMAGLIPHILYQISPDETGWSAASPFRPPLSEASPETNLKYSQDTGLRPLLRFIEDLINREIIWKRFPDRRYSFRFVGDGDYDQLQDVQTRVARLQGGLSTPEQEWNELDIVMPPEVANHPAARFPAPFPVGFQMMQQMSDQAAQAQQAQQQAGQANMQSQQQNDLASWGAAKDGYQQDQEGQSDPSGQPADAPAGTPARAVGTPPGVSNPADPVLKAIGWPFIG